MFHWVSLLRSCSSFEMLLFHKPSEVLEIGASGCMLTPQNCYQPALDQGV